MKTVKFICEKVPSGYAGCAIVNGYVITDEASSIEELKQALISHLLDEDEIKENKYIIDTSS